MPHELIRWTARRSDQIAACLADLEHEYVTAVDDDGELKPAASRAPRQDAGKGEVPRIPPQYERAVLAGAVVREQLRTTTATRVLRGRAHDVVAHQQAAMPEQLLAPPAAAPEHDDRDPETGPPEAIDLTALRALKESRTDVEALDLTAERLRHLRDAFTVARPPRAPGAPGTRSPPNATSDTVPPLLSPPTVGP
ncbi:hypothetical protein [Streptomyces resistomycificus]|uniref:hypothetical protein n=1 Tax=Streptomyces resistomycificus TaxID=67356 RepID=UPI000AC60BE1|nr:hypothetical protein [Streptomyces resistomycificus]